MMRPMWVIAGVVLLAACGEKPQTLGGGRQDGPAYQGTGTPFTTQGWKQGDKVSWEQQLKTRAQNTQNEYNKVN